ncbi:hypothetical protein C1646_809325 [Rhizophagus diaphanus]|nr:hypothetical protein C1646_809325 [Rhizophagus diaphanus] [Rhizophagus sp. MUCL 43196]
MLKEEENAEIDEVDEESNTSLDDITHPANDTSAKWELITLFNNNIDKNVKCGKFIKIEYFFSL